MQQANQPPKFLQPLAQNDPSKADIPVTSPDDTRASQSLGFPPRTGQPPEAGGVPPQLPDMNGVLNMASRGSWWNQLGGGYGYDATFALDPLINGYPQGALLRSADGLGAWISGANDNAINPDTVGTGWVPGYTYGATALAGQTGGTVTLTPAQASKRVLTVAGTLTSNLVLVVPNWRYDWTVYNNTGGAFSVTVRTAGGSGAVVAQNGAPTPVLCDGVNCALSSPNIGAAVSDGQAAQLGQLGGRLLGIQIFEASSTYTPSAAARTVIVQAVGGGGGGGGAAATGATQQAAGAGGMGGAYASARFDVDAAMRAGVAITIGTAGAFGAVGANNGGNGGSTQFGTRLVVAGGLGGAGGTATPGGFYMGVRQSLNTLPAVVGGTLLESQFAAAGTGILVLSNTALLSGQGGDTPWGRGGAPSAGSPGGQGAGFGAGGSGAGQVSGSAGDRGGAGLPGRLVVYEYA